ncbi:MAG TPA: branched-chain amino acid ABC transporter permease [Candidatus Limnocylindria bacterium]|nr:branched-chain amino acid ABC transporter permease [Candidatus Limnocylindria bacterium]
MNRARAFLTKWQVPAYIALIALFAAVPVFITRALYLRYACNILLFATLAGSLNVINGYTGQTNLGQAGFFAIGAYTCGILTTRAGMDFWLVLPIAGALAAAVGLLVALPTLKLSGIYLSIVTLGASEIIRIVAQTWTPVTGGSLGIKSIPYPWFFGVDTFRPRYYYYILLILSVLFLFVTRRVLRSRVGRSWISIREDQVAAKSLGIRTSRYKSINFMYGAFWAGVMGCAYAPFVNYIEASQFSAELGFNVLAMIVIGGQGTLVGPVLGSAIVTLLTESLRFLENWRYVIYSTLIIAMMWLRPQGIAGASNSMLAGGILRRKARPARKAGATHA